MPAKNNIALIGPAKSGKSTLGALLAARLGVTFQTYDVLRLASAHEHFDEAVADRISSLSGLTAWYRHLLPFGVEALQKLSATEDGVVELTQWYPDPNDAVPFEGMREFLSHFQHVILLKPAAEVDDAMRIVNRRCSHHVDGVDMNAHFLQHRSNYELAKQTVYTKGRTPQETRDEILSRLDPGCDTFVMIGPMRAGKSTQGLLVSQALGRKQVAMDDVRWGYYKEIGWSAETQTEIGKAEGMGGVLRYWKLFEIHAVERVLQDHPGCVIDFGAGHSVYEDEAFLDRARAVLAPIANVILLLPSADLDELWDILRDRDTIKVDGMDGNRYFLKSPAIAALSSHVIVTNGKTPEENADEIMEAVGH